MNDASTTRPRHALRWVLGVGLVFVVVVAMALQAARRRADERWESVVEHWIEWKPGDGAGHSFNPLSDFSLGPETRGGSVFRAWRRLQAERAGVTIVLRQDLSFFGSSIEARMSTGDSQTAAVVRAIFAEVGVELVVEP